MTKAGKRDAASHSIRVACDSLVSQCVADGREAKKKAATRGSAPSDSSSLATSCCRRLLIRHFTAKVKFNQQGEGLAAPPESNDSGASAAVSVENQRGRGPRGRGVWGGRVDGGCRGRNLISTFSAPLRCPGAAAHWGLIFHGSPPIGCFSGDER